MNRSESVKGIAPAFLAAQAEMRAAAKDAENPHFRSRYSDFASVVDAVRGPLNAHGIAYLQPVRLSDAGVEIETVLMHTSGEFYGETLIIPVAKRDAQSVGSAISYGKRYALQSICGLPSDDDDGNAATEPQQRQPEKRPAPSRPPQQSTAEPGEHEKLVIQLHEAMDAKGYDDETRRQIAVVVLKKHKVATVQMMPVEKLKAWVEAVKAGAFDKAA